MEKLFGEFPPVSAAEWKARLEKDLKGITFEQLSATDRNGIVIHPFYTGEDIQKAPAPLPRHSGAGWDICSLVPVTDAAAGNRTALKELNNGATGLFFDIQHAAVPAELLSNIELPYIYSCFRVAPPFAKDFLRQLKQLRGEHYAEAGGINSFIYLDYISNYLQTGDANLDEGRQSFGELFRETGIIGVDAGFLLNAGASSAYELACCLALINEYVTLLEEENLPGNPAKLHVTLSTDTAFFEQISKLRAFRRLLRLLLKQYNISPTVHLHIETAQIYRAPFDSYSNLLRDTIAGMAAVMGGCDSLYIRPFNESVKMQDDFGCRMSRNQQLIFREESYLNKVADVAAGSYYIETLTEQLAGKAWELFKGIEAEGGLLIAFRKGTVTEHIRRQAAALVREYKEGKRVLVGVNRFPNPGDGPRNIAVPEAANDKAIVPLSLAAAIV